MKNSTKIILVLLFVGIVILVFYNTQTCQPYPNAGALNDAQHFSTNNNDQSMMNVPGLTKKEEENERIESSRESQKVANRIDTILKNTENNQELDSLINGETMDLNTEFTNPQTEDINVLRNDVPNEDVKLLDELIRDANTGNNLVVNDPTTELYRDKARSINSATDGYRKISYKDSKYRQNFNGENNPEVSKEAQSELDSMYEDAVVFRNNEYNQNDNYKGFSQEGQTYGSADLKDLGSNKPETQQEKVMSLYNSNNYLPNEQLLNKDLTKGFQILDNPVSVSNPNLIPVLKSIPVSSTLGSNRNATWDIRSEPPCPKTVVSPFLNSTIMPDIYATQRGCL